MMLSKSAILTGAAAALLIAAVGHVDWASAGQLQQENISSMPSVDTEVHHVVISYADLNLKRPADVVTLYHRIDIAAGFACGSPYLTGSRAISPYWTACKSHAVNDAVASLHRGELTAYAQHVALLAKEPAA